MVDATHAPAPATLSPDTSQALNELLAARNGGQDNPELAAALGHAVRKDVDDERYGEGEARALLQAYGVPYPADEPKPKHEAHAEHEKKPEPHHDDDKKPATKAKA